MELARREEVVARLAAEAGPGRWLVGVSGGGDSVALLRLLLEAGLGARLVVANFNHRWSAWSDGAEDFVRALARAHGLAFVSGSGSGRAATNAEAAARKERMAWLVAQSEEQGLAGMALAHTRTDQVEGFLMRAGKGSGVHGLSGMKEVSGPPGRRTWRPLLDVGREELRAYLRALGQDWLDDPDNAAGGSQRARVRKLLPLLAEAGVGEEGMAASVRALARADEALLGLAMDFWRTRVTRVGDRVAMEREVLLREPLEIQLRVVERVILMLAPADMAPRTGKRGDLLARIGTEEAGVATLGGVKFSWDGGAVRGQKE